MTATFTWVPQRTRWEVKHDCSRRCHTDPGTCRWVVWYHGPYSSNLHGFYKTWDDAMRYVAAQGAP